MLFSPTLPGNFSITASWAAPKLTRPVMEQNAPIMIALGMGLPMISRAISVAGMVSTLAVVLRFRSSGFCAQH